MWLEASCSEGASQVSTRGTTSQDLPRLMLKQSPPKLQNGGPCGALSVYSDSNFQFAWVEFGSGVFATRCQDHKSPEQQGV
jgi:hypothetical protein